MFEPEGAPVWEKKFVLGDLTAANAIGFNTAGDVFGAGSKTGPDGKSSEWWIKKFSRDGRELPEWDKTVRGKGVGGAPVSLHVSADNKVYVLGSGSGWRFSGSWLERWWGWE